ncbi:MAG TPA: RNA polymerase sigma factor [Candidatus Eisenbacteria bacterium]|jgi:RNA polymerase sigma-70 factor (ECF subfamily)
MAGHPVLETMLPMNGTAARDPWMDEAEETGFVRAAQHGDRAAFLALTRYYLPSVYRVVYALTCSREDTLDLTLDTFARAWKGIQYLSSGQPFYVWITRIARNLCVSHQRRRSSATDADSASPADERPAGEPDRQCARAFMSLSSAHQHALALRVVERLNYLEIAKTLDLSVGGVIQRVSSARAALQGLLSGTGKDAS